MHKEFEQMIIDSKGRIHYIVSRYSHAGEFDDMYQEILLQLWRSFDSFQGQAKRETWVYKIALNTACTFVRTSIKHKEIASTLVNNVMSSVQPGQENCQADILNNFIIPRKFLLEAIVYKVCGNIVDKLVRMLYRHTQ